MPADYAETAGASGHGWTVVSSVSLSLVGLLSVELPFTVGDTWIEKPPGLGAF
jgi:hypothetical protein